jgi:hypothetical protein
MVIRHWHERAPAQDGRLILWCTCGWESGYSYKQVDELEKHCRENNMIKTNKIRCKHCEDVIESTYRHDYVSCKCGAVAVDGGKDYLRRSFKTDPDVDYEELSIDE